MFPSFFYSWGKENCVVLKIYRFGGQGVWSRGQGAESNHLPLVSLFLKSLLYPEQRFFQN